jgi:hypothetical protein
MDRSSQRAAAAFHGCRSAVGRLRASGLLAVPGSDVVTDDDGYCSRNGSGRRVVAFGAGSLGSGRGATVARGKAGPGGGRAPLLWWGCPLEVDGLGVDRRADRRGGDEPAAEVFCGRDRVEQVVLLGVMACGGPRARGLDRGASAGALGVGLGRAANGRRPPTRLRAPPTPSYAQGPPIVVEASAAD